MIWGPLKHEYSSVHHGFYLCFKVIFHPSTEVLNFIDFKDKREGRERLALRTENVLRPQAISFYFCHSISWIYIYIYFAKKSFGVKQVPGKRRYQGR